MKVEHLPEINLAMDVSTRKKEEVVDVQSAFSILSKRISNFFLCYNMDLFYVDRALHRRDEMKEKHVNTSVVIVFSFYINFIIF